MIYTSILILSLILYAQAKQHKGANIYDTYNADDCQRVRKSWTSLPKEEKQLYIDAIMELRANGQGQLDLDEFIAIASVHEDGYGEVDHMASSYLFWHGYLLWELESRIRNLGGKYRCFAVPYWDFSDGSPPEAIFSDILGGKGDVDNYFNVNGYSWKYTTKEFWVPAHCDAEGDQYPLCSLKRSTAEVSMPSASETGSGIINNPVFADFDLWYGGAINLPHNLLTDNEYLHFPVVTSYDPIWYLFHSMVSYHQAIWTDCNEYDMIDPDDLDKHPEAYESFCNTDYCGGMNLDDRMFFGGYLPDKQWSFIHNEELTIRKAYHLNKWNIVYDLGNGDGFFTDSGLKDYCKGKLNPEWFMYSEHDPHDEYYQKKQEIEHKYGDDSSDDNNDKVLDRSLFYVVSNRLAIFNSLSITVGILVSIIFIAVYSCKSCKKKQEINDGSKGNFYGSV